MANISDSLKNWSTTAGSNQPDSGDAATIQADLQQLQATIRADLASKGADIASATTTDLGAVAGHQHDITGTTTITGLGTVSAGIWKIVKFEGALTLTHNATSLILPAGANITTADGDVAIFESEGSGNWRCVMYSRASGQPIATALSVASLVVSGATTLSSALTYGGVALSNAVTGTGNMALSASPTFTGTLAAGAITSSGALTISMAVPDQVFRGSTQNALRGIRFIDDATVGEFAIFQANYTTGEVRIGAGQSIYSGNITLYSGTSKIVDVTSTGLAVTGTLAAGATTSSGTFTSTAGNNSVLFNTTGATTGYVYGQVANGSAALLLGVEGATPALITGSTAYDAIIRNNSSIAFSANAGAGMQMRLSSTGLAVTGTLAAGATTITGALSATTTLKSGGYTVATLPAGATGLVCYVTDQLTAVNAKGAAPTGGGAVVCYQYYNGAAWVGI